MAETDEALAALLKERPTHPVYCIHPERYREAAQRFISGFPGRVLYAVKANDEPQVLRSLHAAGIRHYDCASLPEVKRVRECCPDSKAYFMIPVRLRGAAGRAYHEFGVRHFIVDQAEGVDTLAGEVELSECVVFARMAVHHASAAFDLSSKFGAAPESIPAIVARINDSGAEPALAFNVGSSVGDPAAYSEALATARDVLETLPVKIRLLDVGGGFPHSFGEYQMPPLERYFAAIRRAADELPLAENAELMGEPGRALAAPGVSVVVEVLQRKEQRLYMNDGMYGAFWELRYADYTSFPWTHWRDGEPVRNSGKRLPFRLFGPTCDSIDVMPDEIQLPADIRVGDYLQFFDIGAYSLAGRTRFNGHFSDQIVVLGGDA